MAGSTPAQSPPGVVLRLDLDGRDRITESLLRLRRHVADLRPVLGEMGAALHASTLDRFERSQGPDGRPWRLFSAETLLARAGGRKRAHTQKGELRARAARIIAGAKLLIDRAHLMQSIHPRVDGNRLVLGSNLAYARIHQLGGKAGRGRKVSIPARPYLGLSAADRVTLDRLLARHLARGATP